jgi:hypothetical protein
MTKTTISQKSPKKLKNIKRVFADEHKLQYAVKKCFFSSLILLRKRKHFPWRFSIYFMLLFRAMQTEILRAA